MEQDASTPRPGAALDETRPHSARIWNYWLDGKDNFAIDRQVGDQVRQILPSIVAQARADRAFLGHAVTYLTEERGIRQFLDIGTGLPTAENTHQVAQRIAAETKIVYVDNDPLVLVHARALLTSTPEGTTDYVDADLHEPEKILEAARATLDFTQPIGVMLVGVLHHVADSDQARAIVSRLVDELPSGSYLVVNHATNAVYGEASDAAVAHWNQFGKPTINLRSPAEITRFFDGLELLPPGVVSCSQWRPGHADESSVAVDEFAGVGRKA